MPARICFPKLADDPAVSKPRELFWRISRETVTLQSRDRNRVPRECSSAMEAPVEPPKDVRLRRRRRGPGLTGDGVSLLPRSSKNGCRLRSCRAEVA